jgi:hypothetical protein
MRRGMWILSPGRLIPSGNLLLENACLRIMQCDCIGRYPPSSTQNLTDFALTGSVVRESKAGVADC